MNDDKKIEVIFVQPMREAQVIEIGNDLESMQELVDGYIEEYMPFEDDAAIVCNGEGKMMGLAPNRAIYDQDGHMQEVICGSFFISKIDSCIRIIDIMISRNDQHWNTCFLDFAKLPGQLLMVDLLPVHGNIAAEHQC